MEGSHKNRLIDAVKGASSSWQQAFNAGDAEACANCYEANATMIARPFGTYIGRQSIQAFWQKLIEDGLSEVEYIDPKYKIIDSCSAELTADWKMNQARGVILRELWILQTDGNAKLREDEFEAFQ
ncbi:MAG: isochorismatase [Puniceicoccaceae bacterium MED-G30]|nr:MAG: isochorismatase [Puniceicoccaceae bacterium MED-G30]